MRARTLKLRLPCYARRALPNQVLKLLESKEFGLENDVRFVPLDPLEPLSISNFCMTNAATRFDLCFMWRRVHCAEDYKACFEPKCNPTIYVSSRLAVEL